MPGALVIGGTTGIGRGVAEVLAADGWTVRVTGVSEAEVAALGEARPEFEPQVLDVRDADAVARVVGRHGRLDGLVNCAGILRRGEEFDLSVFEQVIDVNLTGTMRCCLAAKVALKATGGAIVNTASMLSTFGGPLVPAYSASKGGVAQLTKALAGAWASEGIRVNAVAPGWIETEMTAPLRADPERSAQLLARTPQRRFGTAEDVGRLVAWLLSERAGFVTGAVYPVDGGYSAM